jgi:hypothetical protein
MFRIQRWAQPKASVPPGVMCGVIALLGIAGCGDVKQRASPEPLESDVVQTRELEQELAFGGLDESKQSEIWDLEHFTFELEQKFGKSLTAALQDRNREVLASFLREDFSGAILAPDKLNESSAGWWIEKGWNAEGRAAASEHAPVDQMAIVDHLVEALHEFAEISASKLRVLSIDADDSGSNLWKLKLLITARGKNSDGGPVSFESHHEVVCQFSSDEEIESGRIVTAWRVVDEVTRSAPGKFLEEITEEVGLAKLGLDDNWTSGQVLQYRLQVAVDDFNRDGFPDLAVCTADGRQDLLLSVGGISFRNATLEVRLPPIHSRQGTYLASWFDFDNDGYSDLLMGASLYRNLNGERFEDVTTASGLSILDNPMGCAVADYDGDGLLDLYIVYQGLGSKKLQRKPSYVNDDESGSPNQLWRNLGGGKFEDVTEATGVGGGNRHSFAAAWLHANDDLLPDLYVANDFGTNSLFVNHGDHFEDVTASTGVGDFATSMGVATGDVDGDGEPEIYVANMYSKMGRRIIEHVCADDYPQGLFAQIEGSCAGNRMYARASGTQRYQEHSVELGVNDVGWAYAPALVDLDGDGFLDIYATTGFLSFDRKKPDG